MAGKMMTVDEWKKESTAGMFAMRWTDLRLKYIDGLMALYETRRNAVKTVDDRLDCHTIICSLYFALDSWLKETEKGKVELNLKRKPGVQKLYEQVVKELCRFYDVKVNELPNELEDQFGKEMEQHGRDVDLAWVGKFPAAKELFDQLEDYMQAQPGQKYKGIGKFQDPYMTAIIPFYKERWDVEKYRVWFRGGTAYQLEWWDDKEPDPKGVKLDTVQNYERKSTSRECAGYTLSMGRDLYVGQHIADLKNKEAFFHSAYLAGAKCQCAGEIRAVAGKITLVNSASGHYKPKSDNLMFILDYLKSQGVGFSNMATCVFDDGYWRYYKAEEFFKKKGKMDDSKDRLKGDDPWLKGKRDPTEDKKK
jgi:hypothetical protein